MIALAFVIELLFVIGFPLLVGAWIHRRLRVSWLLFAAGAITFGLSQAVHLPLTSEEHLRRQIEESKYEG